MLRDVPRIYLMFFALLMGLSMFTLWYTGNYQRGADTLNLNDYILSSSVSEVDQASRLYEGSLLLNDTFELTVWDKIKSVYPIGSTVQFDYLFDKADIRFNNIDVEKISSPTYKIGGNVSDTPSPDEAFYMTDRPVLAVRVKVHKMGDKVSDWTYSSTLTVDASSR